MRPPRHFPVLLGSPKLSWALLGFPERYWVSWALVGSLGFSQAPLGSPGFSQALRGSPGNLFSAVRDSRMWCLHDIGRDSWVWGEQETLYNIISPHEVGEEAVTDVISLSGKNGVALG